MRILAGSLKNREVLPSPGDTTRPITAMVKKSVFDTLGPWLPEATVADLYCGTGTLGLEALSRGAARCYFADRDRSALLYLRKNLDALGVAERSTVWAGDVTDRLSRWLAELTAPVDIAFVDPPYPHTRAWSWDEQVTQIFAPLTARLGPHGVVVLRLPADVTPPEVLGTLAVRRTKCYGDMTVSFVGHGDEE